MGEVVAVERAPISHEIVDGAGTLNVGDKIKCAEFTPTRDRTAARPHCNNSIFSTVPGSPAYVAMADTQRIDIPEHGFQWSYEKKNAIQSDWEARLRGRVVAAGSPWPVIVAIAAAWALALAAQATGAATLLHHDVLIEDGPGAPAGLALFILAWPVMIAAMMLPSSLPLVRLFARASAGQPRPRAAMAGFLGGYVLVWSGFGALAFGFDLALHAAVDANAGLHSHEWLIRRLGPRGWPVRFSSRA